MRSVEYMAEVERGMAVKVAVEMVAKAQTAGSTAALMAAMTEATKLVVTAMVMTALVAVAWSVMEEMGAATKVAAVRTGALKAAELTTTVVP